MPKANASVGPLQGAQIIPSTDPIKNCDARPVLFILDCK